MRRFVTLAALGVLAGQTSCIPQARVPMRSVTHASASGKATECLVAFLPGFADSIHNPMRYGFVEALHEAGVDADVTVMDANVRYYMKETVFDRLEKDLFEPARAKGYKRIFLVGLSMGGLGVTAYAFKHPGEVSGMMLIAPFIGPKKLSKEIIAAGGVAAWSTEPRGSGADRLYRDIWMWLKGYLEPDPDRPAIFLAFGRRDASFLRHRLLTEIVPPTHVFVNGGGHKWVVWKSLWDSFVKRHGDAICR